MKPKYHVVSFSGGKDSTAMLLRMIEENMQIDEILFCDTGLEFPEMYDHVKKVEEYIDRPITKLKAEKDFMYWATEHRFEVRTDKMDRFPKGTVVNGYGYPNKFARWCTTELKTRVVKNHIRELTEKFDVIQYHGIAVDEPKRVKDHQYPLVEWNMTEADCLAYCKERGFDWGGLYDIWHRVSCWCCPLQGLRDFRKLREHRPELWERLREMDKKIQSSYQPELQFNRTTFVDMERRFEVEDEFVAQGKKLRSREFFNELKKRNIRY